ncbi:MAG: YjbE family putative metal transport protein [Rhodocyclales bacterium]|nr:YjbE family putative metal transport protein [Rhodocyclales bacterium]
MEVFNMEFLSALAAIVVIDLVLAGDNAIVIALASRNVPRHRQRQAILWGTVGAIVTRSALTLIVVYLLKIPGLLFAGGVMLVWIAYKLLLPENGDGSAARANSASTFWGAIRTIVVADMVMGLDNVLAVAGAAQGSFLLVIMGLLISIPIVVWGSTMLLRFVERFPGFVYLGAGVLALTAAKMISAEPYLKEFLSVRSLITPALYVVILFGVLWAGFVQNHRRLESRISARISSFVQKPGSQASVSNDVKGGKAMLKILVPIDGSRNSRFAVQHVIREFMKNPALEIHLLNVQPPFSWHIARFISKTSRDAYHRDEAAKAMKAAIRALDKHNVPYALHTEVGDKAKLISDMAHKLKCDHIVMSTARKNSLTRMLEDSVTNKVLELTSIPVEVIAGDEVSRMERYGIPAGIGALLAFMFFAAVD